MKRKIEKLSSVFPKSQRSQQACISVDDRLCGDAFHLLDNDVKCLQACSRSKNSACTACDENVRIVDRKTKETGIGILVVKAGADRLSSC